MNALTAFSWLDWKLGARLLLRYPALTIMGGFSLAGAIAIGSVGIELANELMYKRLPFHEGGRIVRLETQDTEAARVEPRMLHDFSIWRGSLKTVKELGAARVSVRNVLTGEGRVESLRVAEITSSAFPLTRVPPLLGRPLQPADEAAGAEPVVVLGYEIWQRQFLQDPGIIGRVISVGRTGRTVVGVMPPQFGFPRNQQAWVPLPVQDAAPRDGPVVEVFGRLADGASWQDAAAELDVVSARAAADQPATHAKLRTRVRAFTGRTPGDPLKLEDLAVHAVVLLLLAAVSANVATLIFARTAMRESEIVVRHALGASRSRVIAQIVIEVLVLALFSAVLGLIVAQATVRYAWDRATQILGSGLPFWVDVTLEPATIAYALLLALVAAALIGLLPALKATGVSVQRRMQGVTGGGGTMGFGGIWSFIIGGQVACTLLFVPAAVGIFTNTVLESRWPTFPVERYLTFRLSMDNEALAGEQGVPDEKEIAARRAAAYEQVAGRLRQEPGVMNVAQGDRLPTMAPDWVALEIEQEGAAPAHLAGNFEGGFAMASVGVGYHDAFGAKVVAGRGVRDTDVGESNWPVVVNESFVRAVGKNPVGARIRTVQRGAEREQGDWHEIVGVVTDSPVLFAADWDKAAYVYRAATAKEIDPVMVVVRVAGNAAPLAPRVASLARQVDAGLHLEDIVTLDTVVGQEQMRMVVAAIAFACVLFLALAFAAAGLYALMTVAVARRTREIGIRVALGATRGRVLRSIFARAGRQLGGGIIAGNSLIVLLAWRADSLTAELLVSSVITSVIMVAVGALACTPPARRALRIQPTEALRQM